MIQVLEVETLNLKNILLWNKQAGIQLEFVSEEGDSTIVVFTDAEARKLALMLQHKIDSEIGPIE